MLGNPQHQAPDVSVLAPAGIDLAVPVSCVEQFRWGTAVDARRASHLAPVGVRGTTIRTVHDRLGGGAGRQADQGAP